MLFKNMTQKSPKKQYAYRCYIMIGLILSIINTSAQELVTKELIINGDFEQGNWGGWDKYKIAMFERGFFLSRPGTETPVSQKTKNWELLTATNPTGGNYYMVTDQIGAGINVLLQTFTVPEGTTQVTLQFQLFVNSYYCDNDLPISFCKNPTAIINRCGLSLSCGDNQHARVDILRANTNPFSTSATDVLRNLYLGIDYGSNPHNYTTYSFDITDTVITPGKYILRFAEVDNRSFLNMGIDNISIQATIVETPPEPVDNPTPATCQLYGVQDNGLNNSEFFTFQQTGETNTFGNQLGYDIESLAIHPVQHWLYGTSSSDVDADKDQGYLYRIDAITGELYPVGDIKNETMDFDDVDSLSFNHADNTFWGWAKGYGLIRINPLTAYATLEFESRTSIEGLAWDISGNLLYGTQGTTLWVYDKSNNTIFKHHCILPAHKKIEGLEMIQYPPFNDGNPFLVMSIGNLIGINLDTCNLVIDQPIPYNDVEGLAFEPTTCGGTELPLPKLIAPIHYQPYQ